MSKNNGKKVQIMGKYCLSHHHKDRRDGSSKWGKKDPIKTLRFSAMVLHLMRARATADFSCARASADCSSKAELLCVFLQTLVPSK